MHVSEGANPSCQMTATKGDWWRGRGGGVGSRLGSWRWVVLKPWFAVSSAFPGGTVSALFGGAIERKQIRSRSYDFGGLPGEPAPGCSRSVSTVFHGLLEAVWISRVYGLARCSCFMSRSPRNWAEDRQVSTA